MSTYKIVIMGSRKGCSYTRKFFGLTKTVQDVSQTPVMLALKAAFPGTEIIDADYNYNPADYKKYRIPGMKYPTVRVYDGTLEKGNFVARNMTPEKVIAKITELCPDCCDDCGDYVVCPTCGGTGKVLKSE